MRKILMLLAVLSCSVPPLRAQCTVPPIAIGFGAQGLFAAQDHSFQNPALTQMAVHVYVPVAALNPVPVIFFAHGYGAIDPTYYGKLIDHIVSRGYAVVYSTYPAIPAPTDPGGAMNDYQVIWSGIEAAANQAGAAFDTTQVGFMGHSLGGGAVPYLARKGVVERGWGKRGVLLFVMAPWYVFGVTQQDLETFPPHAKLIMQVYDNDFTNDHRMAKDVFENISIPSSEKEYVTLFSDSWSSCTLDADHFTPLATGISFGKEDALDYYGVYRLFDALAAYTFTSDTAGKALALAHGSAQQRFMGKWPGGPYVRELSATAYPEITHPESYYQNPWSNQINPRRSQELGPLVYWLGQNHPNPFNSSTKISFSLPVAGPVVLSVNDVLGRSVAVLVNGMVDAGEHQLDFTPVNLSSGIYFVRMQSGGYSQQRSIVYLK